MNGMLLFIVVHVKIAYSRTTWCWLSNPSRLYCCTSRAMIILLFKGTFLVLRASLIIVGQAIYNKLSRHKLNLLLNLLVILSVPVFCGSQSSAMRISYTIICMSYFTEHVASYLPSFESIPPQYIASHKIVSCCLFGGSPALNLLVDLCCYASSIYAHTSQHYLHLFIPIVQ